MSARASRASSSAIVAGSRPPTSHPVSVATTPRASTALAFVDRVGSGSRGWRTSVTPRPYPPPPVAGAGGAGAPYRRPVRTPEGGRVAATALRQVPPLPEGSQVEVVQRDRLAAGRAEAVVRLRVPGHRV